MDFDDVVPQERIPARWGYYDINTGEILLPPAYDEAGYFVGDFAWVKRDCKYGFINREGNLVVDYIWDEIKGFNLGLCPVRQGEKWGYIDDNRILVIDLIFDEAGSFIQPGKYLINAGQYVNNSIARVRLGDKYGFINVNGGYIIEPLFEDTLDFWNIGYAGIKCAGKWGLINNNGMLVVVPQFDQIGSHYESLTTDNRKQHNESNYIYYFIVQTNGQWGIMDERFNVVMPEPNQRYVVFQGYKIYINNGRVTSTRKIKT